MKYVNAKAVLPYHLVEELQEYIQAGYIYIPAREDRHRGYPWRSWGISTVFLSTPYEKLYIRSKPWGAAVRGSLFRQV